MASSLGGSWDSEANCVMHQIFSQRMLWREIITGSSVAIKLDLIHSRSIKVAEDAVCVFMRLRQSMPLGIYPLFYWLLQGEKKEEGHEKFLSRFSLFPKRVGGNNGDTQTSWKVVQNSHLLSPACVYTMDGCLQGMWTRRKTKQKKKRTKKVSQSLHRKWWQSSGQNLEPSSSSFTLESLI